MSEHVISEHVISEHVISEHVISSWQQLQEQVGSILEQLNANQSLAVAAAVNPLYALEELGYEIRPEARAAIEERLRFPPRTVIRLRQLRATVYDEAGRSFDLDDAGELAHVLFDELHLSRPELAATQAATQQKGGRPQRTKGRSNDPASVTRPLPVQMSWTKEEDDPLEALRGAHPVVEPLLAYRRLEASRPRLAPRSLYDEVRRRERRLPVRRLRGRLKESGAGLASGQVDLNAADAETLAELPGIGAVLAGRIVAYREAEGPFTDVEALRAVEGVGDKLFERLRPYLTAGG